MKRIFCFLSILSLIFMIDNSVQAQCNIDKETAKQALPEYSTLVKTV